MKEIDLHGLTHDVAVDRAEDFVLMEKGQVISSGPMTELTDELVGKYLAV